MWLLNLFFVVVLSLFVFVGVVKFISDLLCDHIACVGLCVHEA